MKFTKTHENLLILLLVITAFFFWHSIILFPIKLVSVIFHEFAHVIGAYCSGGTPVKVIITNDLGGITSSKNINEIAVLLCGYPGSVIFGVLTYLFAIRQKYAKFYISTIAFIFLLFGLLFIENSFGTISSIIIAAFFISILFIKNSTLLSLILKFIALINISYVIYDIIYDTFLTTNIYSDAVRLEQLTGITDWLWGVIWISIASVALFFVVKNMFKIKRK